MERHGIETAIVGLIEDAAEKLAKDIMQLIHPIVTEADVQTVMTTIKGVWPGEMDELRAKDGREEGMAEGTWVLYLEGGPEDWPSRFMSLLFAGKVYVPVGVRAQAYTNWGLQLFPSAD